MANTKTKSLTLAIITGLMSAALASAPVFAADPPPAITSPFGSGSSSSSSGSSGSPPSLEPIDSGTGTDTTKDSGSTLKKDAGSTGTKKDTGTSTKSTTKDSTSYVQPPSSTTKSTSTSKAKVAKTGPEVAYLILPSLIVGWLYRKRKK